MVVDGWEGRWVWRWVGVVGPAGMLGDKRDQEGCALIGLGAEFGDINRG